MRTTPCPGTLLSLQTAKSGVLAETATMPESFPAWLHPQASAKSQQKDELGSPAGPIGISHSSLLACSSDIEAFQETLADPGDVL